MREFCTYGSVRGASGNRRPYRDFWRWRHAAITVAKAWAIRVISFTCLAGPLFSAPGRGVVSTPAYSYTMVAGDD
jgi:hypothetical protein